MDSVPDLTSLTTPEDMTVMMILPGTLPPRGFREGKIQLLLEHAGPLEQMEVEGYYCTELFFRVTFTMATSQVSKIPSPSIFPTQYSMQCLTAMLVLKEINLYLQDLSEPTQREHLLLKSLSGM